MKVEYSHNNSGGKRWITDQNWRDLAAAGWEVKWGEAYFCNSSNLLGFVRGEANKPDIECESNCQGHWASEPKEDQRSIGELAWAAIREGLSLKDTIAEWEAITGQDSSVLGCSCCGPPHRFSGTNDKGEWESYSPEFPTHGAKY